MKTPRQRFPTVQTSRQAPTRSAKVSLRWGRSRAPAGAHVEVEPVPAIRMPRYVAGGKGATSIGAGCISPILSMICRRIPIHFIDKSTRKTFISLLTNALLFMGENYGNLKKEAKTKKIYRRCNVAAGTLGTG